MRRAAAGRPPRSPASVADPAASTIATMRKSPSGGLVYSTEGGRMCPTCRRPLAGCSCPAPAGAARPRGDDIVRVSRRTQGRGGRTVTVVDGVEADAAGLAALAKALRTLCGSGGTVKDGVVEVQGDHCERVIAHLRAAGHHVKRSGG
jgi:translation initiation factor 1